MDPFSAVLLFAAAGIALWLWDSHKRTMSIVRERRAAMAGQGSVSAGDTGGQGGIDGGAAGHADGGACGVDGGGGH